MRLIDADNYEMDILKAYDDVTIELDVLNKQHTVDAIIIPENATNGDMIMAMFPDAIIEESEDTVHLKYPTVNSDPLFFVQVSKKWWKCTI